MLADDLLEDGRHLAGKAKAEDRASSRRRAVSTAHYAVFHLLIEDFIEHWEFEDQRARLARMFDHQKMGKAGFSPKDEKNLTQVEAGLMSIIQNFRYLQKDRHRADYDLGWEIADTHVAVAITRAEETFEIWRRIRGEDIARHHLLSMFGANR
jgi:hypothetical protein